MGNIGAYIGLFLGYSALQIPDFIQWVTRQFRKYFPKRRSVTHNVAQHTSAIHVQEAVLDNSNQCSTSSNPNYGVLSKIQSELERVSEKVEALEKVCTILTEKEEKVREGK